MLDANNIWNAFLDAATARNWIVVAALIIGLLVRLLKSDTRLPLNLPPAWRPAAAMALGFVSSVLIKVQAGVAWPAAIVGGLLAGVVAIEGHEWLIERFLGDHEIPIPLLTLKGVDPSAPAPLVGRGST